MYLNRYNHYILPLHQIQWLLLMSFWFILI